MEIVSNKRQRSEEKSKEIAMPVLIVWLLILFLAISTSGCASTLDKSIGICAGQEKDWEYSKSEGFEKFSCRRGK